MPWNPRESQLLDAFRGPLYTSFKVSEMVSVPCKHLDQIYNMIYLWQFVSFRFSSDQVSNHQYESFSNNSRRKISLHDLCLQVSIFVSLVLTDKENEDLNDNTD